MRRINQIRAGLSGIPNSLMDFPPEPSFRGVEPGVTTTPIWTGDYYEAVDQTQKVMIPEESFSDSEEENENEAGMPPDFDPVIEIGADVDETFPALGGEAGEQIRRSILLHGMDALGWYVSFHVVLHTRHGHRLFDEECAVEINGYSRHQGTPKLMLYGTCQ